MKKKVCMLTTGHPALDDRIFYKEARSLHQAGFEVSIIAPLNEDGFLTDMGRRPIAKGQAVLDGINILGFRSQSSSRVTQWLHLASVKHLRLWHAPSPDIIDKGVQMDADIYHCHEIWSLYAAIQIKQILEKQGKSPKLVCDVHEFWPAANSRGIKRAIRSKLIVHFEKVCLQYIDYVITANHITRGHLLTLNRFIRAEVIDNCPVLSIFQQSDKIPSDETVTICHEGSLPFNRGLKEMLEVMKVLKNRYNAKVRLLIVGDVFDKERDYFVEHTKEYGIEDVVERTGWLAYQEVGQVLSSCSIGIIFMQPKENNMLAGPPNKLFNYMRYGMPIVTVDLPETRRIVLESQCGIVVIERTADSLANALSILIDDRELRVRLGRNAQKAVYDKYNWGVMESRLLRIYRELTSSSKYVVDAD